MMYKLWPESLLRIHFTLLNLGTRAGRGDNKSKPIHFKESLKNLSHWGHQEPWRHKLGMGENAIKGRKEHSGPSLGSPLAPTIPLQGIWGRVGVRCQTKWGLINVFIIKKGFWLPEWQELSFHHASDRNYMFPQKRVTDTDLGIQPPVGELTRALLAF